MELFMLNLYRRHTQVHQKNTRNMTVHTRAASAWCMSRGKLNGMHRTSRKAPEQGAWKRLGGSSFAAEARGSWRPVETVETARTLNPCMESHAARNMEESCGKSIKDAADQFLAEA